MKDTLNLVGDGDDVDVIHGVERTFGIKLTGHGLSASSLT
ncbi:hypothetical protein ACVWYH_000708 [Bradyrhizobium sp. GM24.11]